MKKTVLSALAVLMLLALGSCSKERQCRCSVLGAQTVRVYTIDKGKCEDLRYMLYDEDPVLYPDLTDSVLCTDFDFESYEN
ncbi:MAG: hypothetical protein IJM88_01495 [Bacteroidales bacterium]|nr:hypothetical protein [Bacteroidales bacterium]